MTVNSQYMKELAVFREKLPCLLSRNCEFALGDIFSPLDFAFVNSMAEIDTSLPMHFGMGRWQIVSFR